MDKCNNRVTRPCSLTIRSNEGAEELQGRPDPQILFSKCQITFLFGTDLNKRHIIVILAVFFFVFVSW